MNKTILGIVIAVLLYALIVWTVVVGLVLWLNNDSVDSRSDRDIASIFGCEGIMESYYSQLSVHEGTGRAHDSTIAWLAYRFEPPVTANELEAAVSKCKSQGY